VAANAIGPPLLGTPKHKLEHHREAAKRPLDRHDRHFEDNL
jgi:hypothetical protein